MPNIRSNPNSHFLKRLLRYFSSRYVLLLCFFVVLWSLLLSILYYQQKEIVTAEVVNFHKAGINSAVAKLNLRNYQSLLNLYELGQKLESALGSEWSPKTVYQVSTILDREVRRTELLTKLQVIQLDGEVLADASNFRGLADDVTTDFPWANPAVEDIPNLAKGEVFLSGVFPQEVLRSEEEFTTAMVHAFVPIYTRRETPDGFLAMTFGFCPSSDNQFESHGMIVTPEGFLLSPSGSIKMGEKGFNVSSFAEIHGVRWDALKHGASTLKGFPGEKGISVVGKYHWDFGDQRVFSSFFKEVKSSMDFYILSPVYPKDYQPLLGVFNTKQFIKH